MRRPLSHGLILAIVIATAFYAAFLPGRVSSRAVVLANPIDGLTYSGVVTAKPAPEFIAVQISTLATTQTSVPLAVPPASVVPDPDEQDVRVAATGAPLPPPPLPSRTSASPATSATNGGATGGPGSPPIAARNTNCEPADSKLYCIYTVQPGDTLSGIAAKFGLEGNKKIEAAELLVHSNRPNLTSTEDILQIGEKLYIPFKSGVIHTVVSAQTLTDIADIYDVGLASIVAVSENGITDLNSIRIGQQVFVPEPQRFFKPAPPAPPPPAASAAAAPSSSGSTSGQRTVSRSGFIWPTTGPISSYFGPAHPLGIDIDLYANPNAPIVAAAAGTVVFTGGNACCSYGYYVVVDHGNGYETLYAHLSRIAVSVGQKVNQGDILGYGGRSGYATGNHLHFEVRYRGTIINPLTVLP